MGDPGALRKKGTKETGAGTGPAPTPAPDGDTVEAHLDTARAALDAALKAHDAMRKSTAVQLEKRAAVEAESEAQAAERDAAAAKISALSTAVADLKKENLALKFRIRKTESEARAARETAEYALKLEKEAEAALAETGSEVLVADTDDDDGGAAPDDDGGAAPDDDGGAAPDDDGGAASDSSDSVNGESYMVDHFAVGIKIDPKVSKPFYMLVSELDADTSLSYEGRGRPRSVVPLKPSIFSFKILSDGEIAENAAAGPAGGTLPTPDMLRANKWISAVIDQLRYAYADGAYAKWIEKHHDGIFGTFIADLMRRTKGDIGPFVDHLKQIVISNATVVRDFPSPKTSDHGSDPGSDPESEEEDGDDSEDDPLIERYSECPEPAYVRVISTGKEFDVEISFGDSHRLQMKPWSSGDYASTGLTAKELKKNRYSPKKCQKVLSDLTGFSRSAAALHTALFDATEQLRKLATLPADPKRPLSQTVLEWYIRTELSRASEFAADMENKTFPEIVDAVEAIQRQCAKAHSSLKRVNTGAGPAFKRSKK